MTYFQWYKFTIFLNLFVTMYTCTYLEMVKYYLLHVLSMSLKNAKKRFFCWLKQQVKYYKRLYALVRILYTVKIFKCILKFFSTILHFQLNYHVLSLSLSLRKSQDTRRYPCIPYIFISLNNFRVSLFYFLGRNPNY